MGARRAGLTAAAVAALLGALLADGSLTPVLADLVSRADAGSAAARDGNAQPRLQRVAEYSWTDGGWTETRPEWSPLRGVPVAPTAPASAARSGPVPPSIAPPENPGMRASFYPALVNPRRELEARHACPQARGPAARVRLFLPVGGAGAIDVTWFDLGDPDTQGYELGAVPLGVDRPPTWVEVAAPGDCREVAARIAGLVPGRYEVWLRATNVDRVREGRTYQITRAQSGAVVVT